MDSWFNFPIILASTIVETKQRQEVKIVFIRHPPRQKQSVAFFSTDITLSIEKIIEYYGAR
jgi:hypothetical protein